MKMGGTYSRHGRRGQSIGLVVLASGLYTLDGFFLFGIGVNTNTFT
jgi:hypothetical protein